MTSSSRNVIFSDSYQPYGQDNGASGSETYRFTGKPYSAATGLYYEYQRWYDPSIGRFISQDPKPGNLANPQGLNPYVYVRNCPCTLTDPSGEKFLDSIGTFFSLIVKSATNTISQLGSAAI